MPTECSQDLFDFGTVEGRRVVGAFDGGQITSDAGALLLGAPNKAIRLIERFAACFRMAAIRSDRAHGGDAGRPAHVRHRARLRGHQRPRPAAARSRAGGAGRQAHGAAVELRGAGRQVDAQPAGACAEKVGHASRYHKISHDEAAIEALFVTLFLEAHATPPKRMIIDLDATDDPIHGEQEGRFFHGYYDCYCYLPLYIFCGRHLLAAKLRRSDIDAAAGAKEEIARIVAQIRERWPEMRIILRADSGFARDDLMAWCEENGVDYIFGLARNERLVPRSGASSRPPSGRPRQRERRRAASRTSSGARSRAGAARAASSPRPSGPRARPTRASSSPRSTGPRIRALPLRGPLLRARRHGEPHQGVPDRHVRGPHAGATMRANQLRLWFAAFAYVLALRAAPHRAGRHGDGRGDLRHHPAEALEDRRAGDQRAARQDRDGIVVSLPGHLRRRLRPAPIRGGLRPPQRSAQQQKEAQRRAYPTRRRR